MKTMKRHLLSMVLVVASGAATAHAQPAPAKPDVSALEASGGKHYSLAEYDAAIADFKEAYRISSEPGFLYNIAQSYRMKNECRDALTFYKNYLREATQANGGNPPPNAAKVQQWITEMDKGAAPHPAPPPPPPPQNPPPPRGRAPPHPTQREVREKPGPPPRAGGKPAWMRY